VSFLPRGCSPTTAEFEVQLLEQHPIRIPSGIVDNEELTASEFQFLRRITKRGYHVGIKLPPFGLLMVTTTISQLLPSWPDFPYTSKVFRFASLAFCTGMFNKNDGRIQRHLQLFHQYMYDAIDSKSFEEILLGSYAAMMFYMQMDYGLRDICIFIGGIFEAASLRHRNFQLYPDGLEGLRTVDRVLFVSIETLRLAYFTAADPLCDMDTNLISGLAAHLQTSQNGTSDPLCQNRRSPSSQDSNCIANFSWTYFYIRCRILILWRYYKQRTRCNTF